MRISTILVATAATSAALVLTAGSAHAGEINGTGKPADGKGLGTLHAHSICAFSGLEDGDGAGFPGPGNAPPQNWGHARGFFVHEDGTPMTPAEIKATGEQPGDSCNGHTGFLSVPGGPTP